MKKYMLLSVFLITFITAVFPQDALKPRIAVFPLINPASDNQVDIISDNVKKTAELTLKMIDRYEVVDLSVKDYENSNEWFSRYTVENSIDSIIFGKADMKEDGSVLLEMSVFSRADNSITMSESETAETVFDIFDASDSLLVSMMESFSGMEHIGFGSLNFINSGEEGKYSLFIDNVLVGENTENLPKVLNGDRVIRIEQSRMFGNYVVHEETFFLKEGDVKDFEFSIPGFTAEELSKIQSFENYIDENWEKKYSSKKIDKNFTKLEELFLLTDYSSSAEEKKTALLKKRDEWQIQKQKWGIQKGLSILDKRLGFAGFYGMNMSIPGFTTDDPDAEQSNEIGQRYGASVSFNILKHLALQAEYNFTEYRAKIERLSTIDTFTVEMREIPVILLLRMPNKVMSAYGGISFLEKIGSAVREIEDISTGDITETDETDYDMVKTNGTAFICGALFEIPMNMTYLMFDFRYFQAFDNWSKDLTEELVPKYFSASVGLGFKLF